MATGLDPITRVGVASGTGDVVGPASAVNDRIAVFDGTTGKLIKDGGSTIAEIVAGSGGLVTSVFARTGNVVAATNDYTWAQINKATSSIADITTRSAGDLDSGTLLAARMPALTGDVVTTAGAVSTSIVNNAVTLAKMADIATASFLGRNTAGTGDPEVLSVATAKTMLGLTGSNTGDVTLAGETYLSIAGQVITANAVNLSGSHVTSTLPAGKGGTGQSSYTIGDLLYASSTSALSKLADVATGNALISGGVGAAPSWGKIGLTTHVSGILPSANGGTGSAFFAVAGPSVLRTYTFPDANATIARTDTGQTFTGTNNFQHILPALTDTYDLGSSIKLWRKGWLSELDAVLFAQNTASVIGGWLIIGKNEGLIPVGQDVGSGDTSIDFGQAMTLNDFVLFRAALQVEYVQVGSLVSGTRYNVTRNVDGSGANAWVAGTVYLVLGNTGNGRIELNSNSTPRISLITQGSAYNTQTEMLRVGDLNGSWNVSVETYGFAVGQYGVAGKTSLRIDDSGIHFYNNITERIQLLADGSGYLANTAISWTTAGVATISGWTVNTTYINNSTTYLASGFDIPASGTLAWIGRSTSGQQGYVFRDGSDRAVASFATNSTIYPYTSYYDGTRFRVVIGGLNNSWGSDGSTNSMGMKVWDSAGTLLVHFSDVANAIAGWTIGAAKISSTGIDIHSGANAALAFGSTPPTSASAGTGIWLDRTGLYGLASNVVQAKVDATTGKIVAGGGNIALDVNGIIIETGGTSSSSVNWVDTPDGSVSNSSGFIRVNRSGSPISTSLQVKSSSLSVDTTGFAAVSIFANNDNASALSELSLVAYSSSHSTAAGKAFATLAAPNGVVVAPSAPNLASTPIPASTVLEVRSTTGAFLPPRMTTTQRDALTATDGMLIYNSTTGAMNYRKAGAWVAI